MLFLQEMSVEYGRVMSTIVFDSHVAKVCLTMSFLCLCD